MRSASPTEALFLALGACVWVTGACVSRWRHRVPGFVLRAYLYGGFAARSLRPHPLLDALELRKATFRHFYVFAAAGGTAAGLLLALEAGAGAGRARAPLARTALALLLGPEPRDAVCAGATLCTMLLLMLQVYKRLYETHYLQVFGEHSKINISHYAAGFIHYLGCIVTIVGQSSFFSGITEIVWWDNHTRIVLIPCVCLFILAWHEQYRTNVIFANLRRDSSSGKVVTEEHCVPYGRLFKLVSSPHRLTEIMMYTVLIILFPTRTFFCIYFWVFANQVQTAIQAHQWYQNQFRNYPRERCAVFPFVL